MEVVRLFCTILPFLILKTQLISAGVVFTPMDWHYKVACLAEHLKVSFEITVSQEMFNQGKLLCYNLVKHFLPLCRLDNTFSKSLGG